MTATHRATKGENVLLVRRHGGTEGLWVGEGGEVHGLSEHWTFTELAPPQPPERAVVLDTLGMAWQRGARGWLNTAGTSRTWRDLHESRGPLRVLHEPAA